MNPYTTVNVSEEVSDLWRRAPLVLIVLTASSTGVCAVQHFLLTIRSTDDTSRQKVQTLPAWLACAFFILVGGARVYLDSIHIQTEKI